jgi:hypothetical protein
VVGRAEGWTQDFGFGFELLVFGFSSKLRANS